jgi:hypothetical protein
MMTRRAIILTGILVYLLLLTMCVAQADVSLPPRREGVTPMATSATNVGQNVKVTQTAKKITIEIDTTKEFGKSKSGKTISTSPRLVETPSWRTAWSWVSTFTSTRRTES